MELQLAILLFALSASITPGPNNIMIMASGVNFGVNRSLPHLLGICFGFPVMLIMVGLGLSTIFVEYPSLHEVIKVLGLIYLLYLARKIAFSAPASLEGSVSKPFSFSQAAFFQWVNPKAWVMAISAISAFTSPSSGVYIEVLVISLIFFLVTFPCVGAWLFFGVGLKRFLRSQNYLRLFNASMASLLVVSVLPVIVGLIKTYTA